MRWNGWNRWCAWLAHRAGLGQLSAVYAGSAALCAVVATAAAVSFVDLHVYRAGALAVLHGAWLYGVHYRRLPFTYPPFAAIVLAPLGAVPWWLAVAAMLIANAAATPVMFYLALRLRPVCYWLTRADAARLALGAAAVAVWLEPAYTTIAFGQVNILITVLVLIDLTMPDDAALKGVVTGIAAGVKLIPLIFVLYLAATRRMRSAVVATGAFAVTIAIGYAVVPAASEYYYSDLTFLRSSRVAPVSDDWNQSLLGAIARNIGREPGLPWLGVVLAVGAVGIALAARAARSGDDATGYGLCAVTGLLVSPISWTHHWVMALPALLVATVAVWRRRRETPRRAVVWVAVIAALAAFCWSEIARNQPRMPPAFALHLPVFWLVVSQVYVMAGLAALGIAAAAYLSRRSSRSRASPAVLAVSDGGTVTATQPRLRGPHAGQS